MNTGERDELVLVPEIGQLVLEGGDLLHIQVLLPVERGRTVVGKQLSRVLGLYGLGELARETDIRRPGLAPDEIGIGRIGDTARDGLLETVPDLEETFRCSFACTEGPVVFIHIRGQQRGCFGIGTCKDECRYAHDIRSKACSNQFLDRFLGWHQNLASHVAAFLHCSELILEVNPGCPIGDHVFHEFESVEDATETGLGIGHDWQEVVDEAFVTRTGAA